MSNVTVHALDCDCQRRSLCLGCYGAESPVNADRMCPDCVRLDAEVDSLGPETVPLEMADGSVAPVVPGTTRTEYGVRCSADNAVTWWPDVTDGLMARIRMAETDARCDFPHLLVSREVPR